MESSPDSLHLHSSSPSDIQDNLDDSRCKNGQTISCVISVPSQHFRRSLSNTSPRSSFGSKSSASTVEKLMVSRRRKSEIVEIPEIKTGYMLKQCRILKTNWTKRFFSLDLGILTNCHSEMDSKDVNKMTIRVIKQIHLNEYILITDINKSLLILEASNRNRFTRQNLTLYIPNKQDYKDWEMAMNKHVLYTNIMFRNSLRSIVTSNSTNYLSFSCHSSDIIYDDGDYSPRILPNVLLHTIQLGDNNNDDDDDDVLH